MQLQGVGSFAFRACLGVTQGADILAQLHDALQPLATRRGLALPAACDAGTLRKGVAADLGGGAIADRQAWALPQLSIEVQQLALVRYASHDIAGPLVVEGLWDLQLQQCQPQRWALWAQHKQ